MTWGKLITGGLVLVLVAGNGGAKAQEQAPPVAAFKSSIDMVRVAAVVRDSKGRFVRDLTVRDFEVLDSGRSRPISDLQSDLAGVSVAILFDVSGSMEGHLHPREAAMHVLSWLGGLSDEAAALRSTRTSTSALRSRRVSIRCPIR
jgi:Ca-activated chloride channel family protein